MNILIFHSAKQISDRAGGNYRRKVLILQILFHDFWVLIQTVSTLRVSLYTVPWVLPRTPSGHPRGNSSFPYFHIQCVDGLFRVVHFAFPSGDTESTMEDKR